MARRTTKVRVDAGSAAGSPPDPLPRGPHRLTAEQVQASQRERLCSAALDAVAEFGYGPTTVADIVTRARVSRRSFYEIFDAKEDCFAAAFDVAVKTVETRLNAAVLAAQTTDFRALVRISLESYLEILASEPSAAHALHVQTLAAGPALVCHRERMQQVFAARMRGAHRLGFSQGDLNSTPDDGIFDLLIGGIDDRIRFCLQHDGPQALPSLAPLLDQAAQALFTASSEMGREG